MSDVIRLLEEEGNTLERELLDSARDDAPSPTARQATLAALGLGGSGVLVSSGVEAAAHTAPAAEGSSLAPGAGVSAQNSAGVGLTSLKAAAPVTTGWLLKWFGGGTLAGLLAAGAAVGLANRDDAAEQGAAPAPSTAAVPGGRAAASRAVEVPVPASPAGPDPVKRVLPPSGSNDRPREALPKTAALAPKPRATAAPKGTVFDEVAVLDSARGALARGDAPRAIELLDEHRRRFPSGALGPEATVLRIRAELGRGNRSAAYQLAERFLSAHPDSPHAARVHDLVGEK